MEGDVKGFSVPDEPTELKARIRALLEDSPEEGGRVIADLSLIHI